MEVGDVSERTKRALSPCSEPLEPRTLATLVFLLNGNAFAGASPSTQTQVAAADLARRGDRAIQMSYPNMNSVGAFNQLAGQIRQISRGQPIGLAGFSAGGTLALRLAQFHSLNVKAVLDFYGPPDLASWISQHHGDIHVRRVLSNINYNQKFINAMSGSGATTAYIVSAFGTQDTAVYAAPSAVNLEQDFPGSTVNYYSGPHGVTIGASYIAYEEFLNHL
jgi:dienelactone hydrolase